MPKIKPTVGPAPADPTAAVAGLFPSAVDAAVTAYRDFAATDPGADARGFAQHQSACKAALSHIEGLLKLARLIAEPAAGPRSDGASWDDDGSGDGETLAAAERAFAGYRGGKR